jgi:hypothetical protein
MLVDPQLFDTLMEPLQGKVIGYCTYSGARLCV